MTNPLANDVLIARVKGVLQAASSISGLQQPLVKGRLRELLVDQLLQPMLPPALGIGNGIIVDSEGGSSGEIDIVIFNRDILPPLLFSERDGIFPVEACLYAVEIKSMLRVSHLEETLSKFDKIQRLKRLEGANPTEPIGTVFAFASDVGGSDDDILRRCDDLDPSVPPLIRVGCVAGRQYWYYDVEKDCWGVFDSDEKHHEVVSFVGGFTNTTFKNHWSPIRRGQFLTRPDNGLHLEFNRNVFFGAYVISEGRIRMVQRNRDAERDNQPSANSP
jgi:hypothetical protein